VGKERKLTKAQLVDSIYLDVDVAKKDVHQVLDLFFEAVKDGLLEDRVIELRGFGTFELRTRRGRQARNPKTGETVRVGEHGVAVFRPGRELKQKAWEIRG
jgi:integration host factor subunit beta